MQSMVFPERLVLSIVSVSTSSFQEGDFQERVMRNYAHMLLQFMQTNLRQFALRQLQQPPSFRRALLLM
jgi:hypothetical protein